MINDELREKELSQIQSRIETADPITERIRLEKRCRTDIGIITMIILICIAVIVIIIKTIQ